MIKSIKDDYISVFIARRFSILGMIAFRTYYKTTLLRLEWISSDACILLIIHFTYATCFLTI